MTLESLITWAVLPLLGVAFALGTFCVLRGPTSADRVVALDTLASIGLGLAAALAVLTDQAALGDVVLVVALVSFLGTIAYARFLEQQP